MPPVRTRMTESIVVILENAERLLNDAEFLEFGEPPTTGYFLAIVAQEELSKAFLLSLVLRGAVPWDAHVLRATRDHKCKQLLGLVMDYLSPDIHEFMERCNAVVLRHERPEMPAKVADALNILRHEKIGRWESRSWVWAEEPVYDRESLAVAEGEQDKRKQDALYVRVAADGGMAPPSVTVTRELVRSEMERAKRFATLVENMVDGSQHPGLDYEKVEDALRLLFTRLQ
jgi:AbiV family abortive infection protein